MTSLILIPRLSLNCACRSGDLGRAGQVAPDLGPEVEVVLLGEVEPGRDQHLLGLGRIEVGPRRAAAGQRDRARGEVLGGLGARRVEVVGDPLPVDPHRDRLADGLVVPRGLVDVEAEVQDVERLAREQLQGRVALDRREIVGPDVVDPIDRPRLELLEPLGGLGAPLDHDRLGLRRGAPVVRVCDERDVVALDPFLDHVRAGPVGGPDVAVIGGVRLEPVGILDVVGRERDLGQERDVRRAQVELDRQPVERLDLAERPGVAGGRLGAVDCGRRIRLSGVCLLARRNGRYGRGRRGRTRRGRRAGAGREHDRRCCSKRAKPQPSGRCGHAQWSSSSLPDHASLKVLRWFGVVC